VISLAFPWGDFSITWANESSISLEWAETILITLGIFALDITLIQEYLDREKEKPSKKK
jgi:hypothetical protein